MNGHEYSEYGELALAGVYADLSTGILPY